eukprot:12412281-Alexandrium_andersonii.AAC.1
MAGCPPRRVAPRERLPGPCAPGRGARRAAHGLPGQRGQADAAAVVAGAGRRCLVHRGRGAATEWAGRPAHRPEQGLRATGSVLARSRHGMEGLAA